MKVISTGQGENLPMIFTVEGTSDEWKAFLGYGQSRSANQAIFDLDEAQLESNLVHVIQEIT